MKQTEPTPLFPSLPQYTPGKNRLPLLSQLRLGRLKNAFKGRTCFVIGNGPSLRFADLDKLQGKVSIASNKIFLAYPQTSWRPTLYTIGDPLVWDKLKPSLKKYQKEVFIPDYLDPRGCDTKVRMWHCAGVSTSKNGPEVFQRNPITGWFGGYTVTYENLQFAAWLGCSRIVLLGCDHYYREESKPDQPQKIASDSENHFIKGYRAPGEVVNSAPVELMTHSYGCAQSWARVNGVQILNATRGGHLEVFPRIALEDVLAD